MNTWFRMHHEFVDDPKVQRLQPELFKFWVNCLGLTSQNHGKLPPLTDISWKLKLPESRVQRWIEALISKNLLDQSNEDLKPHNWEKRQYKSDVSTERVKRFRNGSPSESETPDETFTGNKRETPPDTDTEAEQSRTEQKKKIPKNSAALLTFGWEGGWKWVGKASDEICAKIIALRADTFPESDHLDSPWMIYWRLQWFEEFWAAYEWNRKGKKTAREAYFRHVHTLDLHDRIVASVVAQCPAQMAGDPKYRPMASTWLNGERWNDPVADPSQQELLA